MELLLIFTMGYVLGGITALVVLALTLASRRGQVDSEQQPPHGPAQRRL
jgi:hypothetical protein